MEYCKCQIFDLTSIYIFNSEHPNQMGDSDSSSDVTDFPVAFYSTLLLDELQVV